MEELTHDDILQYLGEIEAKYAPKDQLLSERDTENFKEVYPYREQYLETILSRGEPNEKFETLLARLYIEKLFEIMPAQVDDPEMMLPDRDIPLREKLNRFLKTHDLYDTAELLKLVRDSWMKEEQINLLAKDEQYEHAI